MTTLDKFKLQAVTWDSDKDSDPRSFQKWAEDFSSIVRATEHGGPLEDLIDDKVGRQIIQPVVVPSYLKDDPDFAAYTNAYAARRNAQLGGHRNTSANGSADSEEAQSGEDIHYPPSPGRQSGTGSRASAFTLGRSRVLYDQLPDETLALDSMLYNILRLNIKGSKVELLSNVMYPSYVQGMIILYKHTKINRTDRKTRAFSLADSLTFDGDVQKFQIDATGVIRELSASKCSIMYYALHKVMRAFDGGPTRKAPSSLFTMAVSPGTVALVACGLLHSLGIG